MAKNTLKTGSGFTIVEMIVVVTVIAILAGITIIGYGAWQQNIAKDQMKSDLNALRSSMEAARNFSNAYPAALPADFEASKGVTVAYVNGNDTSYCIEAQSVRTGSLKYYLSSSDKTTPKEGSCPPLSVAAPNLNDATVTGSQVQLAWSSVPASTSYDIQYRRNVGSWTTATSTTSNKTINGLTLSSTYDFQVRATVSGLTSGWSSIVSRKTLPTPAINGATDLGCGNSGGVYAWHDVSISWPAAPTAYTTAYRFEGNGTYGKVPLTVANPTGTGSLTATTSTERWQANQPGFGAVYLYGIGPNGEKSAAGTWTSQVYPAYDC